MKRISILLVLLIVGVACSVPAEDPGDIAPRNGKYMIYSFGAVGSAPLFLGYFVLADGSYKAFLPGDKVHGEGKYSYDKTKHEVTWLSGPYAGAYGGAFTVENGGKRHQLRLKSTTVATNEG
jgi:hypothetical protein